MVDSIRTQADLVIWVITLIVLLWLSFDTRRIVRVMLFAKRAEPSVAFVLTIRVVALVIACFHVLQIALHFYDLRFS
jgi:hypothetical protein